MIANLDNLKIFRMLKNLISPILITTSTETDAFIIVFI